jgi:uncharacterized membrane protein
VLIITAVILVATILYLLRILSARADENTYKNYRHGVARALLLRLEILVAADVIRTVALEPPLRTCLCLASGCSSALFSAGRSSSRSKSVGPGRRGRP